MIIDERSILEHLFINYHLSIIIYEEETRAKIDYPKYWINDRF